VAAKRIEFLSIFGDDYNTSDGTGVRDYIHVVDLAKGHLKALDHVRNSKGVEAYNLGTGKGCSVLELVHTFEKANNLKIDTKIVGRREGDIAECYAKTDKAKRELHWVAEKTLEEMCRDAWNFAKKN